MKARLGYVSNSSSSSFLVYGNRIKDEDALERAFDEGRHVICVDECGGTSGDVAACVFDVTRERYDIIKRMLDHFFDSQLKLIDATACAYPEDTLIELSNCRDGRLFYFDRDENSPQSDSLKDEYFRSWLGGFDDRVLDDRYKDDDGRPFVLCRVLSLDEAVEAARAGRTVNVVIEGYTAVKHPVGSTPEEVLEANELYMDKLEWCEKNDYFDGGAFFSDFVVTYEEKGNVDLPDGKYVMLYGGCVEIPVKKKIKRRK